MIAARGGWTDVAAALCAAERRQRRLTDGMTPLQQAICRGIDAVRKLIELGADVNRPSMGHAAGLREGRAAGRSTSRRRGAR